MKMHKTVQRRDGGGAVISYKRTRVRSKEQTASEKQIKRFVDDFYSKHRKVMTKLAYE